MRLVEHAVRTRVRFLRRGQKPPPPAESAALGRVSAHHNKQGKALSLCPARKLGFRRWGKHSAWLSAPHFPAPGGGFAGRSPHPLPRSKVRSAQNSYGKRKGDQETKENRKRDVTLTIRVTQADKDAIIVNAMHAGKNLTDYILSVNDRAIISPPPDLSPLLRELKRIGTNINQVAAKVNSGVSYVPGLREVAEQQAEIIRRLRILVEDRTWQP